MLATLRRASLLCTLPRANLDLPTGLVTVIGKGHKQRLIPLPAGLIEHLENYLATQQVPLAGCSLTPPGSGAAAR